MERDLKAMLPLEAMYGFLNDSETVEIWEKNTKNKHVGKILGFDEYMNIILESEDRRYMLKGDCLCAIVGKRQETGNKIC